MVGRNGNGILYVVVSMNKRRDMNLTAQGMRRRHKVREGAVYDYKLIGIAERLVAGGHTIKDLGYIFNVSPITIQKWKERYPEFNEGCKKGYAIANAVTMAQFLRSCWGFHYNETRKIFNYYTETDENDNEVQKERLVRKTVTRKYQPPSPELLKFELINKFSDEYRDPRRVDMLAKNLFIGGEPEIEQIQQFFGLTKQIINNSNIQDGKNRPINAGTGTTVDSEGFEPEHSLQAGAAQQIVEGQGDAESVSPALPA